MAEIEDLELEFADLSEHAHIIEALWQDAALARRYGDLEPALDAYCRILELDNGHAEAMLAAAEICRLSGRPRDSLQFCADLLELEPRHIGGRLEMAEALRLLGQPDEAHAIHDLLLLERPDSPNTWCGLAHLLADEGKGACAEACLRRALALDPGHGPAWAALGRCLSARGLHEAALDALHAAITLEPAQPAHHVALADALMALGRIEEAALRVDRALALDDEDVPARLARSRLLALDGHLAEAWSLAQCRWHLPGRARPFLPGCPWEGESLDGASLLLHAEPGLSATLRMARFIPVLAGRGARITLMADPRLAGLLATLPGVEQVLRDDEPPPEDVFTDYVAPLLDLPFLLGLDLGSLPNAPYLAPPPERVRTIRVPANTLVKVGLAWAGEGDSAGDLALARLLGLATLPGILLFSLQTGPRAADAPALADPSLITDLAPTVSDFADLAGRMAEMDVVIATDSPTAHLAAAMGKPVWLLLAHAADPLWLRGRTDSPWYPTMTLLRQPAPGAWEPVLASVRARLASLRDEMAGRDRSRRAAASGPRAAQMALLAAHLQAGDLFLDVGAEDGAFTFEAACHPSNAVLALALEPAAADADILRDALAVSGLEEVTEVIAVAAGAGESMVLAARRPQAGGHRVFALPGWAPAATLMRPLAALLDERPHLAGCRVVVRLNQKGWEAEIVAGLAGRAAIVIFGHEAGGLAAEALSRAGYGLWRFPEDVAFGPVAPFDGGDGMVLALAPGLAPAAHYGSESLPPSPGLLARIRDEAEAIASHGTQLQQEGKTGMAARCYGDALAKDPFCLNANTNLGVLQHMAGRLDAAAACYARALTRRPVPAVKANLGNALRELGRFEEAESLLTGAGTDSPDLLYDLALLRRDQGRLYEAIALIEAARSRQPDSRRLAWMLAQLLLASGRLAEGLALMDNRPHPASRAPHLPLWQGEDMAATALLVEMDDDDADSILMARFIPLAAARGALITLACPPSLAPMMAELPGIEQVIGDDDPSPPCELRTRLAALPQLLAGASRPAGLSYLASPTNGRLRRSGRDDRLRVGITWGGRRPERSCPLDALLVLAADPALALVALAEEDQLAAIDAAGARALVERAMPPPADLGEMAGLIAGVDVVVGGDTASLHLAAAMGKPVLALLPDGFDWRWPVGREDSPWYPSARIFRTETPGDWRRPLERIGDCLRVMAAGKIRS